NAAVGLGWENQRRQAGVSASHSVRKEDGHGNVDRSRRNADAREPPIPRRPGSANVLVPIRGRPSSAMGAAARLASGCAEIRTRRDDQESVAHEDLGGHAVIRAASWTPPAPGRPSATWRAALTRRSSVKRRLRSLVPLSTLLSAWIMWNHSIAGPE